MIITLPLSVADLSMERSICGGKGKEPWMTTMSCCHGQIGVPHPSFSWPPRSYSCSFCKREFKSAQALGGHMNVHRRDKARLRHSPPPPPPPPHGLKLNPIPNPNPNPDPSLGGDKPGLSFIPNLNMPPPASSADGITVALLPHCFSDHGLKTTEVVKKTALLERDMVGLKSGRRLVRLDLEMGIFEDNASKHELDLELRLGYI